jgi:membrane-associated phospholipid phosphatase
MDRRRIRHPLKRVSQRARFLRAGHRATLPERPWIAHAMAIYGLSVAVATVYGRYHFAADAAGGIAISLLAILVLARKR